MLLFAPAQDEQPSVPMAAVIIVLIIAAIIYAFGYLRAVMHRANRDYKTTKAAVPKLRRAFWSAWWAAVKVGFWVVVAIALLGWWAIRDVRDVQTPTPATSPSVFVEIRPK
jgi:ABC-type Fe3+ transport system permease subunit